MACINALLKEIQEIPEYLHESAKLVSDVKELKTAQATTIAGAHGWRSESRRWNEGSERSKQKKKHRKKMMKRNLFQGSQLRLYRTRRLLDRSRRSKIYLTAKGERESISLSTHALIFLASKVSVLRLP